MGPRIKPRSISLVLFFVLDLVIHLNHRHEQWLSNLSGSNISWARWLVLQEISLSIKRDFWIHISRSLATHRLPPSLARKSVRPNVISGGQLSKCGDLLEIEIY